MKKNIHLTVQKPCAEKFQNFQPTANGGFCQACQKEVIDFTQMTDAEVLQYFKNHSGKTCGRFQQSQLKTYPTVSADHRAPSYSFLGIGMLGLSVLSLLPFTHTHAEQLQPTVSVYTSEQKNHPKEEGSSKNNNEHYVQGTVLDEFGNPLPGVNVWIKGTSNGTVTDIDGYFAFRQPLYTGTVLQFSFVGFDAQTFEIRQGAEKNINVKIEFKVDTCAVLGEVSVQEVYSSKRSIWQKIKGIFK